MNGWIDQTIHVNGINIHYLRTGGRRPPVVLLHGLSDSGECWSHLAHALAADYDLIMPDSRGHGRSSAPEQGYQTSDLVADLLGLITYLGLDRPVLIGHSMGGLTAAVAATMAPELLRGMVLEDPAFRDEGTWAERANTDWISPFLATQALSEAAIIAQGRANSPGWAAEVFPPWARAKRQASVRIFDWFQQPAPDGASIVSHIPLPTLLVTGDPSRGAIITPAMAEQFTHLNPLFQVAYIPGVGHCIRYERPWQYAALIQQFLASIFTHSNDRSWDPSNFYGGVRGW